MNYGNAFSSDLMGDMQERSYETVDQSDPFGLKLGPMPAPQARRPMPSAQPYQMTPEFQDWLRSRDNGDWYQRLMAPPG